MLFLCGHTDTIQWNKLNEIESAKLYKIGNYSYSYWSNKPITYFFGHSLSNTDGDLIQNIFKNSEKIKIFYSTFPQAKLV